jgi:hypothetical protein
VALMDATSAVMPLGPKHIAAFTSDTQGMTYVDIPDELIGRTNDRLKFGVIEAYYSQP